MNAFISHSFLRASLRLSCAGALVGMLSSACDLPDKNLGDDPAGSSSDSGGPCEPGESMMMDCNTCECDAGGQWSCTEIACDPTGGLTCDPGDEPVDECNTCECVDGEWLCTTMACEPPVCNPDENPSDGCNTCECIDGQWLCTDEACPETPPVALCDGTEPADPLIITEASITDDTLSLSVEHGGGCEVHVYGSCWDGSFAESDPVQAWLQINHEDNDDPCDAIVQQALTFDLVPLRDSWIDAYQQPSGTITLHVGDWGSLDYTF